MRAPFLLLPITLALSAPLSATADEASRVLFCSGDCFAVDAKGVRTPAPKGTRLLPGQRLETGRGSYAQVKVGTDNAFGVGENARVRMEPNGVFLDEGRIRVVGSPEAKALELRTQDSTFVLRGADIEMKKSGPTGPASPVLVKLNAGEASVSGAALTNGGVQLVTAGSVIPGGLLPSTDIAPSTARSTGPVAQAGGIPSISLPVTLTPITIPLPSLPALPPVAKAPFVRPPVLVLPPVLRSIPPPTTVLPARPMLSGGKGEGDLYRPVLNTTTGTVTTLNTAIIKTIDPTYVSPTLSTERLLTTTLITSPTTTTTISPTIDSTVFTTTKLTTTTTTTTTTFKLLSPTLTTFR
jgi:hypothetical protein